VLVADMQGEAKEKVRPGRGFAKANPQKMNASCGYRESVLFFLPRLQFTIQNGAQCCDAGLEQISGRSK